MKGNELIKVLFVCMGNICRSPTAEGVFRYQLEKNKLTQFVITDSAGTRAYHIGNPPDERAQKTSLQHNIDLSSLVARKVTIKDFNEFDYIIAMDKENLTNLKKIENTIDSSIKASSHLFMKFAKNWQNIEVPDPYYGGDNGFNEVFEMVTDASDGLIKHIVIDKNLKP